MGLDEVVRLRCTTCGRFGRYNRKRYFEIAGTTNGPDALLSFAKTVGCERALKQEIYQLDDRCDIRYDLSGQ